VTTPGEFSETRQVAAAGTRIDMNVCATLSLADAALVLGIHRSTASKLYRRGEFPVPVLQIGHRCRVTRIHLERFLLVGTTEAGASDVDTEES
jgi:hypothetical protein